MGKVLSCTKDSSGGAGAGAAEIPQKRKKPDPVAEKLRDELRGKPIDLKSLTEALKLLPKRCALKCCQQHTMLVKGKGGAEDSLLPLQKVAIDAKVDGAFATIDLDLTYLNPSQESALEATYEFPLE